MIKRKSSFSLLAFILCLILLGLCLFYIDQRNFLKGINSVYILNENKKIVNSNKGLFLTNYEIDKITAKKVTSLTTNGTPKIIRVPFYNQQYIVMERPMGEGAYDYIVFDGNGTLISDSLLLSNQIKLGNNMGASLENLKDDGTAVIKITEPNKSYLTIFDLHNGQFRDMKEINSN